MENDRTIHHILCSDGRRVPIDIRRNRRARRLTLRLDQSSGAFCLVLPRRAPVSEGMDFAHRHADWIVEQLEALPPRKPFADWAVIPYLGRDHRIRHTPGARRGVWRADGSIWVSGNREYLSRRVTDFLKREARREIVTRARTKARTIGKPIHRIGLRDPKTRWGSCSSDGDLNFSWRLIMAPEVVCDYLVAHEVAHLKHLNHGPRFWSLVTKLTPSSEEARAWLEREGNHLHRYG